ncbi:MAG: S9 family peptidase [Crocinitomicaceae bacterium]|nr:S9 family peptidase [Crocinitomicaceae bacterium]
MTIPFFRASALFAFLLLSFNSIAQEGLIDSNILTPKMLIELNRVSAIGISDDRQNVIYRISQVDVDANSRDSKLFVQPIEGGEPREIRDYNDFIVSDAHTSPDGRFVLTSEEVAIQKVKGTDLYPELTESNMMIYNDLNYRHWDVWEDGKYSHVLIEEKETGIRTDIMGDEPFDCPQKPFGGGEDYIWAPDGKSVLYVTKKLFGTKYAVSTNTDIYEYNLETEETKNLTESNVGYDTQPAFSREGSLAYLQMKRDGYESDKNDIILFEDDAKWNLTESWDGTVNGFTWGENSDRIYFTAPIGGTVHLFEVVIPKTLEKLKAPRQITSGQYDVRGIVGQSGKTMVVTRGDMNHATELYTVTLKTGEMKQLSHANDDLYKSIKLSKVEKRITKASDGQDLLSWVIYPPDFDSTKTYPTLLYCQGGPQGALSQFYSYRWNFQLMAAHGYIIIAPNRRGMPGYGVEWNEQISKDYGGQNMQDYLAAIDDIATESYVNKDQLGCVGASYGGYSAFYLAAIHEGRFKTFIAHDGIFNWKSMYGTTEELFFVNWDLGGAYWDKDNEEAQRSHNAFNPSERVEDWTTPIMVIQGGKDYRVPIGQGLEAYQAAQLQGIKSRLLFFPEENHWVLDYQNSLIWHTEFYKWLEETIYQ